MRTIDDLVRDRPTGGDLRAQVRQEPLAAYLGRRDHGSSSTLRRVLRSGPAAADTPFADDGSQRLAQALHALVFEPARFVHDHLVLDRDSPPAEEQAEALDRTWITGAEYARLAGARDAIRAYPREPLAAWIDAGIKEMSIYWADAAGGHWKARPDCFTDEIILELKTTGDVRPRAFARTRKRFGYDLQAAHYVEAVGRLTGRTPRFAYIAVELQAPFYAWVHELSSADLASATARLEIARERLSSSRAARPRPAEQRPPTHRR
ncbi:MAG TPA: PD-(D/E)XK nuclease-like domain-containing protein [Burkholderiales bacterium]|nr:PD-(D/E)XK nuclease-like domain-containing protein [Burkholderiales bacterium]